MEALLVRALVRVAYRSSEFVIHLYAAEFECKAEEVDGIFV